MVMVSVYYILLHVVSQTWAHIWKCTCLNLSNQRTKTCYNWPSWNWHWTLHLGLSNTFSDSYVCRPIALVQCPLLPLISRTCRRPKRQRSALIWFSPIGLNLAYTGTGASSTLARRQSTLNIVYVALCSIIHSVVCALEWIAADNNKTTPNTTGCASIGDNDIYPLIRGHIWWSSFLFTAVL